VPVSRKSPVVCSDECIYVVSQSPAEMHSSYTKTKLGSFYQNDMAINRNHYTDPLDNNQIPPHQSLLPQVGPLIYSPAVGRAHTHTSRVTSFCSRLAHGCIGFCERHVPALDYHSNSLHTSLGLQVRRWAWASRGLPLGMVLAFHRVWLRQAVQATAGEALSRHALPCLMASCRVLLVSIPRAHSRGAAV